MSELITDKHVVSVLRPFVRATTPVLGALRDADPLGLVRRVMGAREEHEAAIEMAKVDPSVVKGLESVRVPGTAAWHTMTVAEREDWWVNRVGRVTVLMAAIPGIGGALADRLPIQDTLATAGQGLVLSAIAVEHGAEDSGTRVRLIAHVLFDRDIDPLLASGEGDLLTDEEEDAATAEMTADLDESQRAHGKITPKAAAKSLWRLGRTLLALGDELDKRPQGRFYHKAMGMLPVVGMAGDYLGERSALKRAAKKGSKWLHAFPPTGGPL
ncbi:hypothetical protein [Actinokineospora globicatena]|uniref:hypothetical protein n=1 Tax=Actinokineospora globicatena TaxID=103729 RepID=UPI0020A24902|nr:hypothetical protein [Actinokineospora globicatena]MCP2300478.1 hypothetical protein [Actinokineospora globicatena]GLW81013.1 hypothetical protein Aglo01_54940 [Actinokineospora globicatena]GLW88206.1 hypothetical protein Aglo02_58450 [Actinokineospora globicatena]